VDGGKGRGRGVRKRDGGGLKREEKRKGKKRGV